MIELEDIIIFFTGNINFFKVYSGKDFYYKYPNGDEVYNVISAFTVKGDFGEPVIDNYEVSDARFFAFCEIPENINPPDVKIVRDIVEYYSANAIV